MSKNDYLTIFNLLPEIIRDVNDEIKISTQY